MEADALLCPKCPPSTPDRTLAALTLEGYEINRCATCGGMWFDKGELGSLLNSDTRRVNAILGGSDDGGADTKTGKCPRDHKRMFRVKSERNRLITIETCGLCQGIWLDGGEFERIKKHQPNVRLGDLI